MANIPKDPKVSPVSQEVFDRIAPGDIVLYSTTATGHRVGDVLAVSPISLVATVGRVGKKLDKVTLTREQLTEWRPAPKSGDSDRP